MSNGKSMAPDGSPRNTLTIPSLVSKRQLPPHFCLPCTPAHLQTKSSYFANGGLSMNNDGVAQSLKYRVIYDPLVKINV